MLGDPRSRARARLAVATAAGLVVLVLGGPAQAAVINVTTTADENGTGPACSLREAITAANTDAPFGGCPAGSGADTINAPGTHALSLGELVVTSPITINNATVTRAAGASDFRIFQVTQSGNLTLNRVTVTGGRVSCTEDPVCIAAGGGILNLGGTLTLNSSRVINNTATCSSSVFCSARGGGINNVGTLTLNNSQVSNNTATCSALPPDRCSASGGGIEHSGTLTLNTSQVSNNTATCSGGGTCGASGGASTTSKAR